MKVVKIFTHHKFKECTRENIVDIIKGNNDAKQKSQEKYLLITSSETYTIYSWRSNYFNIYNQDLVHWTIKICKTGIRIHFDWRDARKQCTKWYFCQHYNILKLKIKSYEGQWKNALAENFNLRSCSTVIYNSNLIHVNCLNSIPTSEHNSMILIFRFPFTDFGISW